MPLHSKTHILTIVLLILIESLDRLLEVADLLTIHACCILTAEQAALQEEGNSYVFAKFRADFLFVIFDRIT